MNNKIILDSEAKETKIYKANFYKYLQSSGGDVSLSFTDAKDESGNVIKKSFVINSSKALSLVGNLLPGQLVSFSAEIVNDEDYLDGFDFIKVSFFGFDKYAKQ